ncbi:MAG: hypothetical protein IKE29_02230 [Paenibacillus sp.]|uniref:hypothetical protein n=1 Tax=Paenibacillus sp. TaxID=58172 RepID=UPI0025E5710A|nr:hypothetical protein [Paenibacillus sp.]MBR2563420.1 hypothetical protein [Paenibacillus sp.]
MDVRDYLNQSYMLDRQIQCNMDHLNDLKEAALTVSGLTYEERLFTPDNSNAGFVKTLYKIDELRNTLLDEIDKLVNLKAEIFSTIKTCKTVQGRVVLMYRHMMNCDWETIADKTSASRRSVIRWYNEAIETVMMPDNPINIDEILFKKLN